MTKEITKSIVLQEIQDKFKLREFDPSKFLFDETVIPVYDVGQHLEHWQQKYTTKSVTGTGAVSCFLVAPNEKWHLARYDVVLLTGVYTVAGAYIIRPHADPGDASVYLDLTAAQAVSYHVELPKPVILEPGDRVNINIDGYTSTGDIRLYLDYMMEEIR